MDKNLYRLIIGAYIHDIGKLIRRGGENRKNKKYNVSHAQLTNEFFKNNDFSNFWKEIGLLASLHHGKDFVKYNFKNEEDKFIAWCIYMADNISAGERGRIDEQNKEEEKESIKHIGLTSIFENIYKESSTNKFQYTPSKLNNADLIPVGKGEGFGDEFFKIINKNLKSNDISQGFKDLKDDFKQNFKEFILAYDGKDKLKEIIYKLDMFFQNYLTLIPSDAFKSIGDISLYDHTKTTAAFAVILYNMFKDNDKKFNYKISTNKIIENKIKLIAGDFPSIQSYIFGGIQKQTNIAKRLRARSLRVQLLSEAVIEYLLDRYNLPRANVLLNAGGKFVILANENIDIKKEKNNINKFLIEKFNGNIKFSIVDKPYTLKDISQVEEVNIKDVFKELFDKLSKDKFKIYDKENLSKIFEYKSVNGKNLCKYCGMNYYNVKNNIDENAENNKCKNCEKEIKLGEKIVKGQQEDINIQYKDENGNFYYDEDFEEKKNFRILFNNWNINKTKDFEYVIGKSINLHAPKDENGQIKSFEDLSSEKRNYLCMVKGDVDSMSLLFKHGFGDNYSVSRIIQFSRFLELFFGKYLNKYLEKNFQDVYTVFSGGDDFVFIVPFKDRKKFVKSLYEQFYKFVAKNENIHFSVGVSIFKDKTPFKQVDEMTEKLLKKSKENAKESIKKGLEETYKTKIENKEKEIETKVEEKFKKLLENMKKNKWNKNKNIDEKKTKKRIRKNIINGIIEENGILKYHGITYYDESYIKIFNGKLEENKLKFYLGVYKDLSDTARYKLYAVLNESLEYLKKNMSKFVLNVGRLLYMIQRANIDKGKKEEILKDLKEKFGKVSDKNKIRKDVNNLLLKLTDNIYEDREGINNKK